MSSKYVTRESWRNEDGKLDGRERTYVNEDAAKQAALNLLASLDGDGYYGGGATCTRISVAVIKYTDVSETTIYQEEE
jgi:hypothetical protein